jgi:hypothetical protein
MLSRDSYRRRVMKSSLLLACHALRIDLTLRRAKISVAHMYGFHRRPVPTISLAPGYAVTNGYKGEDRHGWTFDASHQQWPCVD